MPIPMRCDSCLAMRWYGRELQPIRVAEFPGPVERVYFICAVCDEERMLAMSDGIDIDHAPTMHPQHHSKQ